MHFAHADNNVWSEKYFSTPASPSLQTTAVSPAALGFGIPPFSSPPAQEPTGPVQWNHGNFTWITRWIVFSRSPIYIYPKLHFLSYGCKTKFRGSHALDYLNSIHSFIMHWKGGSLKTQTFLGRKNFWPCIGEESQPFSGLWLQQFGRSNRVVAQSVWSLGRGETPGRLSLCSFHGSEKWTLLLLKLATADNLWQ